VFCKCWCKIISIAISNGLTVIANKTNILMVTVGKILLDVYDLFLEKLSKEEQLPMDS
jgi:hypothetical protein